MGDQLVGLRVKSPLFIVFFVNSLLYGEFSGLTINSRRNYLFLAATNLSSSLGDLYRLSVLRMVI